MYTVYALSLLYIDGYYVGFSENFPRRLMQHIKGKGARVTRKFGVAAIKHTEEVATVEEAKEREDALVHLLECQGAFAWGGGRTETNYYHGAEASRPSRVVDYTAPERSKVSFIEEMP